MRKRSIIPKSYWTHKAELNMHAPQDRTYKPTMQKEWYTEEGAKRWLREDSESMKAEYRRMRRIAEKRVQRLEKSFSQTEAYKRNEKGFQKLSDISDRDLPKAFQEVSKFLNAKASTVSGQRSIRAKTIDTWQSQGLNLTEQNYDKTMQILSEMRSQKRIYGSDKVVSLAEAMMNIPDERMGDWLNHLDSLMDKVDDITEIPNLEEYDADEILEMLEG